jgi:hypothetical protein
MAFIPLSQEALVGKRWLRHTSMAFAKNDTVAPVYVNELPMAIQSLPVAFIKQGDIFIPVVVMGLKPGQNLCVSTDARWLSEYMPVTYRSSPFELLAVEGWGGQQSLCIDESCITDGDGEPFFDDKGEIAETITGVFNLVQQFNAARALTLNICKVLNEHGLIKPWPLVLNDGITEQAVSGLYKIDEEAFNALPDDAFLAVRKAHALTMVYSQMLSMQKIAVLAERLKEQTLTAVSVEKSRSSETFNFGGL